jgi:hypothetical protein
MAAYCGCCGAEIKLKAEFCEACGMPAHGMAQAEFQSEFPLIDGRPEPASQNLPEDHSNRRSS